MSNQILPDFVLNPFTKWPVNLSCFCGSGFKFKKCCQFKIPKAIKKENLAMLDRNFSHLLRHVQGLKAAGLVYFNEESAKSFNKENRNDGQGEVVQPK